MPAHALLALVALAAQPGPAAAPSAAWAQDRREPMCIYDGVLALTQGAALEPAQMNDIRAQCRQRFGWTEDQASRGIMVAMVMVDMMQARRDALDAGVEASAIETVRSNFNFADAESLGRPGEALTDAGNATIRRIVEQVLARGLTGDAARKTTRAVLFQLMATTIIARFAQEVMAPPAN